MRNILLWLLGALLPAAFLAVGVVGPTFAQSVEAPSDLTLESSDTSSGLGPLDVRLTWIHPKDDVDFILERTSWKLRPVVEWEFTRVIAPNITHGASTYSFVDVEVLSLWEFPCYSLQAVVAGQVSEFSLICMSPPVPESEPIPTATAIPDARTVQEPLATPIVPPAGTGLSPAPASFGPVAILMLIATGGGVVLTLLLLIGLRER